MVKVPLTNSPNQTFKCTVPINGKNVQLKFVLSYNEFAKYWLVTVSNAATGEEYFSNMPFLTSKGKYFDILSQLDYKSIGTMMAVPVDDSWGTNADDKTIGKNVVMVWGDNDAEN